MVVTIGDESLKQTFVFRATNTAQFDAGTTIVFQDRVNAEANFNSVHNILTITNQDTTSTLFGFFDLRANEEEPDFVLFPQQTAAFGIEDGITYTTLFIKNTHATNDIAANQVKVIMGTIKRAV